MTIDAVARVRVVALYLPQFHPIPENDRWWGEGFTEWTNVRRAVALFPGHDQPRIPGELGYYDLRDPLVRHQQAALATAHGVSAFCYYHYWFAGTELLARPFSEVLASGAPDFPFCLCWANESWTGIWHGAPDRVLIEQIYPGREDHIRHFHSLLPAFCDPRYLKIHDRPVFLLYIPQALPQAPAVLDLWRDLAVRNGLAGIYFVGMHGYRSNRSAGIDGCDATLTARVPPAPSPGMLPRRIASGANRVFCYNHEDVIDLLVHPPQTAFRDFPCIGPGWDNTPRLGNSGVVLQGSRPELFRRNVETALQRVAQWPDDEQVIFIKSWNEWAEGNYLEPDTRFGRGYLEVLRDAVGAATARQSSPAR